MHTMLLDSTSHHQFRTLVAAQNSLGPVCPVPLTVRGSVVTTARAPAAGCALQPYNGKRDHSSSACDTGDAKRPRI
jgi:hypothetical protein